MIKKKDIALFDMDGTIVDYQGQMIRDLNLIRGPKEPEILDLDHSDSLPSYLEARRRLIKNQTGWWRNLPWTEHGKLLIDLVRDAGFQIHILTQGPLYSQSAWSEKLLWVQDNEEYIFNEDTEITITRNKSLVYGKVLIDDYPPYIEGWLNHRSRGLVIMPAHKYNQDFKHPNVIRFDGSSTVVKNTAEALEKAKKR